MGLEDQYDKASETEEGPSFARGQVAQQYDRQVEELEVLAQGFDALETRLRLGGILRVFDDEEKATRPSEDIREIKVPLANSLEENNDSILRLTRRMRALVESIEL